MSRFSAFLMKHMTAPPTPVAGEMALYTKSDNSLWVKKSDGTEETVGGLVGSTPLTTHVTTLGSGWTGPGIKYQKFGNVVTIHVDVQKSSWTSNDVITLGGTPLPAGIRPPINSGTTGLNGSVDNTARPFWVGSDGHIRAAADGTGGVWGTVTYQAASVERSTAMNSGAESGVTNGAKTNAAGVKAFLRGGVVTVTINASATAAMVAGDNLFTLPEGFRPAATFFVEIPNANPEPPVFYRFHVNTDGNVQLQGAVGPASNALFRGSFTFPAAVSASGLGTLLDTGWVNFYQSVPNLYQTNDFAKYRRVGNTVTVRASVTVTSGGVIGPVLLDYPNGHPFATDTRFSDENIMGRCRALRAGVAWYPGDLCPIIYGGVTRLGVFHPTASGAQWTVNNPANFQPGDRWGFEYEYEAAPL